MAEFKSFVPGIELSGRSILAVVDGMGTFKRRGYEILKQHGLENVNPSGWYSQQAWFDSFKTIYENIGPVTLRLIGKALSDKTPMPDQVKTLEQAFNMTDVVYHMMHRRDGKTMYDEASGKMLPGIGHYYVTETGENFLTIVCKNPYPCVFEMGAGEALAQRFKPEGSKYIRLVHDDSKECRRKGGESCTQHYYW